MSKNNIRSIRFSDEVAKIILDFEGDNFNQKFENLIYYCYNKLPYLKKSIKKYDDLILLRKSEIELYTVERNQILKDISEYTDIKRQLTQIQLVALDLHEKFVTHYEMAAQSHQESGAK